jgi:uroporphyrin-III C-methyltransferase
VSAPQVYLVGAGPGDPELLTFKAARVIGLADVLLVDDLVNTQLLTHAKPQARVVHVGKRGGCASTSQPFISKLMVSEAQKGAIVVRLKGGDPSIFGRAAEEIAQLCAAGIAYEIVPGITAASAAAAQLGAPLTDRASGHGVALITGHTADDFDDEAHWRGLVASGLTLVIYMGVTRCESLVHMLIRVGAPASLPCAVVQAASSAMARTLRCTLAGLPATISRAKIESPALLIIGEATKKSNASAMAIAAHA